MMVGLLKTEWGEISSDDLEDEAKDIYQKLERVVVLEREKEGLIAILRKARAAYISELKSEVLAKKAGIDFDGI